MNNEKKLGQEPAFACMYGTSENGYLQEGMSKRFYAACMAMQGILVNKSVTVKSARDFAEMAFDFADELLKQEQL